MRRPITLLGTVPAALLAGTLSLAAIGSLSAHPESRSHVHVGGGLSQKPYVFTLQTWYRDIVYDDSAEDTQFTSLDVYTPVPAVENAPVMVFVHGGGFRVGDKASSKDLDPKPEFFASKLGYVFVSVNYRLLPEGKYPRNVSDLANALAWVHDNIAEFGGDPDRIFLMGHSAGAMLVAQVATDETFLKEARKDLGLLKGVIANEGSYGVDTGSEEGVQRMAELFGDDWRAAVPITHVEPGKNIPPFLVIHVLGEDGPVADSAAQAAGLAGALRDAGVRADVLSLDHVEHFGANERMGEPGDIVTVEVERFLDSVTGRATPARWESVSFGPPREKD